LVLEGDRDIEARMVQSPDDSDDLPGL